MEIKTPVDELLTEPSGGRVLVCLFVIYLFEQVEVLAAI